MPQLFVPLDLMKAALRRGLGSSPEAADPEPLDHPALQRLGLRELADLPLPRPGAGPEAADALAPVQIPSPEPHERRSAA
jgi:hypothetical protein